MTRIRAAWEQLELVAMLGSSDFVLHTGARNALRRVLDETPLAAAARELKGIEERTGHVGLHALEVELDRRNGPRLLTTTATHETTRPTPEYRFPPADADIELVATLRCGDHLAAPALRDTITELLLRSPLAPAVHRMLDVERMVGAAEGRLRGTAALEAFAEAGQRGEELVGNSARLADPSRHRPLVVHALLDRERALRYGKPAARLPYAVAAERLSRYLWTAGGNWRRRGGLRALAMVSRANAHRTMGELDQARRWLTAAEPLLCHGDPHLRSEALGVASSVAGALRRQGPAAAFADEGVALASRRRGVR
jgi:hypothetical protein